MACVLKFDAGFGCGSIRAHEILRMSWQRIITVSSGRSAVHPWFADSSCRVLAWLAAGQSADEVVAERTQLTRDDIGACLGFAAEKVPTTGA